MAKKDKLTVTLDWKFLEKVANHFEFPVAVFLMNKKDFSKGTTRHKALLEKLQTIKQKLTGLIDFI